MSDLVSVDINVVLSSTFWKDPPKTKVYIDDRMIFDHPISDKKNINWSGELAGGTHKLIVELYDKDKYQTVLENGKIIKDQLLNIEEISIDEIDIGYLKHSLSSYYPDKEVYKHEVPLLVKNCVNLGYNGKWELEFTIPIYIWLLENI